LFVNVYNIYKVSILACSSLQRLMKDFYQQIFYEYLLSTNKKIEAKYTKVYRL